MNFSTNEYRKLARASLERSKSELSTAHPCRLNYAALELRYAMEALTYDRALAFKDELPPEEFETWQPRKLMNVLLEIDETIGMTSTLAIGIEDEPCVAAARENMKILGTDNVLTLSSIKKHYDALGSYLHMPTLEQVQSGNVPDPSKLRSRCEAIIIVLETILASKIWNNTLGTFSVLKNCLNSACGRPIRKRLGINMNSTVARCFECGCEYTLEALTDGRVRWTLIQAQVRCSNPKCESVFTLWRHEIKPGQKLHCTDCGTHSQIALCITSVEI